MLKSKFFAILYSAKVGFSEVFGKKGGARYFQFMGCTSARCDIYRDDEKISKEQRKSEFKKCLKKLEIVRDHYSQEVTRKNTRDIIRNHIKSRPTPTISLVDDSTLMTRRKSKLPPDTPTTCNTSHSQNLWFQREYHSK